MYSASYTVSLSPVLGLYAIEYALRHRAPLTRMHIIKLDIH